MSSAPPVASEPEVTALQMQRSSMKSPSSWTRKPMPVYLGRMKELDAARTAGDSVGGERLGRMGSD